MGFDEIRNVIFPGPDEFRRFGLIIAFTDAILFETANDPVHIFEVTAPTSFLSREDFGFACRCAIRGQVVPVDPKIVGDLVTEGIVTAGATECKAVAFVFEDLFVDKTLFQGVVSDLWIKFRGDFVLDRSGKRAIDAEFVRAEFPTGDRPQGSAFGVQGGTFESWFDLKRG